MPTKGLKLLVNKSIAYVRLGDRREKRRGRRTSGGNGDDAGGLAQCTCRRFAEQAEVIHGIARHRLPRVLGRLCWMWFTERHPLPYRLVLDEILVYFD